MRVEAERRPLGFDGWRPTTNQVAAAPASSADVPEGLDWQRFAAAYFPGRRRHDLEALTAYCAYLRTHEVYERSSEEPAPIEAGRAEAGSTALRDWEDEGGAAR